eukprot:2105589-Rhodomonas_salina.1
MQCPALTQHVRSTRPSRTLPGLLPASPLSAPAMRCRVPHTPTRHLARMSDTTADALCLARLRARSSRLRACRCARAGGSKVRCGPWPSSGSFASRLASSSSSSSACARPRTAVSSEPERRVLSRVRIDVCDRRLRIAA